MELMRRICEALPQTMIYPVSVLSKSLSWQRREIAQSLIDSMKWTHPILIDQAIQISDELIWSAVLLSERWCEAIEECSRIYFTGNDAEKMINFLKPLYDSLD